MKSDEENYSILPAHMRDGARMYIEQGVPPGGFLTAVLSNDFKGAFGRADETNLRHMQAWAQWVVWNCPSIAQGSAEKVAAWVERGGLNGKSESVRE
jgi:hypothetical protein